MATAKQRSGARRDIKKAPAATRRKRTLTRLPAETRKALGKREPRPRDDGEGNGRRESPSLGSSSSRMIETTEKSCRGPSSSPVTVSTRPRMAPAVWSARGRCVLTLR